MSLRKILVEGDPTLNKISRPVEKFNLRLHFLLDDMKETLEKAEGAGLAAPQLGILRRVVIVMDDDEEYLELVNPEILSQSGEQTEYEGCLSVPDLYGKVRRPNLVTVRAQDRQGNYFELTREGNVARCFCHEIEHLDGHLYVEHIDRFLTDEEVEAYFAEQEKGQEEEA